MSTTANLDLEILTEGQANKEASITETHQQLDALCQAAVIDRDLAAQPGSPMEGERYLVPSGATGADWSGQDGTIAHYRNGAWTFITPKEGWRLWVADEDTFIIYDGAAWSQIGGTVAVDDEGSEVVAEAARLNFKGAGVTVSDVGGGQADIDISGGTSVAGRGLSVILHTINPSNAASVDLRTAAHAAGYDVDDFYKLELHFANVVPSVDGASLRLRMSDDDGSNFTTTGYAAFHHKGDNVIGVDDALSADGTYVVLTEDGVDADAAIGASGSLFMTPGAHNMWHAHMSWRSGSGTISGAHLKGRFVPPGSGVDFLFRVSFSTGNIASGTVRLIGCLKSETAKRLVEETGAGRTLSDDDNGRTVHFTNAGTGVTLTVPDTLSEGFSCKLVNETGGSMTVSAGGALTIVGDTSIAANRPAQVLRIANTKASVAAL